MCVVIQYVSGICVVIQYVSGICGDTVGLWDMCRLIQ